MKFCPSGTTVMFSAAVTAGGGTAALPTVDPVNGVLRIYSRKSTIGETTIKFANSITGINNGFPIRDGVEYFYVPPPGATDLAAWGSSDLFVTAGQYR